MPERTAVAFTAHYFDDAIIRRLNKLFDEVPGNYDVFLVAENGVTVPEAFAERTHHFDFACLKAMARSIIGDGIVPGNTHLLAIDFARVYPQYAFYWFVEFDVIYTGNWRRFFANLERDDSDLLATHIRRLSDDPQWQWGAHFSSGPDPLGDDQRILAFLPIYRISAHGIDAVARKVAEGWVGHFEALMPAAVAAGGLRIADIGGSGPYTPADRIHRHYLDCPALGLSSSLGSVRAPALMLFPLVADLLYHPSKTVPTPRGRGIRKRLRRAVRKRPATAARYVLRILWRAAASWVRRIGEVG